MVNIFTETNKGFTIITNFGCKNNCSYCISKHHPILQNNITDINKIDWDYLEKCISETTSPKVNLSGGGDPFFNYDKHLKFFFNVKELCQKYNKLLDIHTRILPYPIFMYKLFNKIALSVEYNDENAIRDLKIKYNTASKYTNIRVIQVVGENLTFRDCSNYIKTMFDFGVKQVTFRQMFGNKKAYDNFNFLKSNFYDVDGVMFLKDGEYHNYYFTTNNTLYPYFFGYTQQDREKWQKIYENIQQSCA